MSLRRLTETKIQTRLIFLPERLNQLLETSINLIWTVHKLRGSAKHQLFLNNYYQFQVQAFQACTSLQDLH